MAWTHRKAPGGIRYWLLMLLIPGVVALLLVDSWGDYRSLTEITEQVYDSALLEPAKVLETSVEFNADGSLRIDPPFYAQVMLESRAGSRKYFRVEEVGPELPTLAAADARRFQGRGLLGMQGLPRPERLAEHEGVPVFYDATYRGDAVRMVALWRDLHYRGMHRQVLVLVGESTGVRLHTEREAGLAALFRDGRMLLLVLLLVWLSVEWALRPLRRLRREVRARKVDNLMPLDTAHVPREVVPLVNAVNHHIDLYRSILDRQAQFLADASHQLRTPLAIMLTQAQYAQREQDMSRLRESLSAIVLQLGRMTRLTEQLLSLANANQQHNVVREQVDLNALARDVVLQYLPLAREQNQDLGWAAPCAADGADGAQDSQAEQQAAASSGNAHALASESGLHEALANLVHNAINHAGRGATITVAAGMQGEWAWVSVSDNGPGLDPLLRPSVFVRFERGGAQRQHMRGSGSGLGLAIALAYAERNGGTIVLEDGDPNDAGGVGLRAVLKVPAY
ncbi:sensor histidine kinase [Candidimonas nitroreducens]|uniref:histidine kinase n=1 Tax=Candidimonas nitroreducens TaxID=683354 RepID=A0A225LYI5_9BURK|nr:sensor histidine kinase [Candidimonas nitroreducens]OWT54247.1 sensor histidine kinase [Candidimonas nitroreducens]